MRAPVFVITYTVWLFCWDYSDINIYASVKGPRANAPHCFIWHFKSHRKNRLWTRYYSISILELLPYEDAVTLQTWFDFMRSPVSKQTMVQSARRRGRRHSHSVKSIIAKLVWVHGIHVSNLYRDDQLHLALAQAAQIWKPKRMTNYAQPRVHSLIRTGHRPNTCWSRRCSMERCEVLHEYPIRYLPLSKVSFVKPELKTSHERILIVLHIKSSCGNFI